MKRAYKFLRNYYVENEVDIMFKLNGSLLVTIIIALIFIFNSKTVPVTNSIVDALDEIDSSIVLEQKGFKSNSEEVLFKEINKGNVLCLNNTHFNSVTDVSIGNTCLYDNARSMAELLMVKSRESSIFSKYGLMDRITDLVYSSNLVAKLNYIIAWNKCTVNLINVSNIVNIAYKLDCHKQGTSVYRKARAPSDITNNALIN